MRLLLLATLLLSAATPPATPSEGPAFPAPALRGAPHGAAEEVVASMAAASPGVRKRGGAPSPTVLMGVIPKGANPMSATSVRDGRTGTITHMGDSGVAADYLAIPLGPGVWVEICGTRDCLTLRSTDAGPNRASLLAGRIADLSVELFRVVCGPASMGVCQGSWRRVDAGPRITPPPTDTEGSEP